MIHWWKFENFFLFFYRECTELYEIVKLSTGHSLYRCFVIGFCFVGLVWTSLKAVQLYVSGERIYDSRINTLIKIVYWHREIIPQSINLEKVFSKSWDVIDKTILHELQKKRIQNTNLFILIKLISTLFIFADV